MHDLNSAIARAVLRRVGVLCDERKTDAALQLLDLLESPNGIPGTIPSSAESHSAQSVVRESADLQRAYILLRSNRPDILREARDVLDRIVRRVGPEADAPSLDGPRRQILLGDVAIAYSFLGDHTEAIAISEFLITQSGAPSAEAEDIAAFVAETERGATQRGFFTLELYNIAVRRLRLAQVALLAGRKEEAGVLLERAHADVSYALQLFERGLAPEDRQSARSVSYRRARRGLIGRIEVEQTLLLTDEARAESLALARTSLEVVVAEVDAERTMKLPTRLLLHAGLGAAICEQALLAEQDDDQDRALSLAWTARALIKPYVDLYVTDADEYVGYVVRYGSACRICGATPIARKIWTRSRERLALRYLDEETAIAALDALIATLPAE